MAQAMKDQLDDDLPILSSNLTTAIRTKDFLYHLSLLNDPLTNQIKVAKDFAK